MSHKFPEYDNLQLSGVNKKVLDQWQEEDLFARTLALREGAPSFVFYEGPPSANGMPGIHHVMARSIKDIFCRYKTMKGFRVDRKAGWDTHGLPRRARGSRRPSASRRKISARRSASTNTMLLVAVR